MKWILVLVAVIVFLVVSIPFAYAVFGDVLSVVEINSSTANGPTLNNSDLFGISVANIGDLDGDGVNDIAVGAISDDEGGSNRGAVHIIFLNGINNDGLSNDGLSNDGGGSSNEHKTKPTFGLDHNTFRQIVDGGFSFNGISHDITDNFWTPFAEQKVKIGTNNSFSAKIYADKQLYIQEFLFGIPDIGDAHKAELGIEVVYDYSGDVNRINVIQKTDIIDIESINIMHSKSECQSDDTVKRCDITTVSMKFLEPLQDSIMAIKAIDFKGRYQITYLNDGFDISGISLNPKNTMIILGTEKHEGLITVTQVAKYSDVWITEDGRIFEKNESDSFRLINESFERFVDYTVLKDRNHSEWYKLIKNESNRAELTLEQLCEKCSDESFGEINNTFAYDYPVINTKYDESEIQARLMIEELTPNKL